MTENQKLRAPSSRSGMGAGGISILAVFVVLCITVFAVLSLLSARADHRLSQRSAQTVEEYYAADAACQQTLAGLVQLTQGASTPEEFEIKALLSDHALQVQRQGNALLVSWEEFIDDNTVLCCTADFAPTLSGGQPKVTDYRVEDRSDQTLMEEMPGLWQGELPQF